MKQLPTRSRGRAFAAGNDLSDGPAELLAFRSTLEFFGRAGNQLIAADLPKRQKLLHVGFEIGILSELLAHRMKAPVTYHLNECYVSQGHRRQTAVDVIPAEAGDRHLSGEVVRTKAAISSFLDLEDQTNSGIVDQDCIDAGVPAFAAFPLRTEQLDPLASAAGMIPDE